MIAAERRRLNSSKIKENLEKICYLLKIEDMANCQLMVRRELALEDDVVGNTGPCLEYILENHVLKQLCEAGLSNVSKIVLALPPERHALMICSEFLYSAPMG